MADQCNQCGSFLNLILCEICTTILCANCSGGHATICASIQARKTRGDGQTVRRVNTLPEPKAELPKPELHPVDDPKQDVVNAGVPLPESDVDMIASLAGPTLLGIVGEPDIAKANEVLAAALAGEQVHGSAYDIVRQDNEVSEAAVTLEPNEGPYLGHDTIAKDFNLILEVPTNDTEVPSIRESVLQSEQDGGAPNVVEGGTDGNGSDSVPTADDSGHVGDASRDSDNGASAPEPEVEMVDPATADGE